MNAFKDWCASDTASAKCTRTIVQGIISTIITFLPDLIAGSEVIPNDMKPIVVPMIMCVLSPIQALIGAEAEND